MDLRKSLDKFDLIATNICDVSTSHGVLFNKRSVRLTCNKLRKRYDSEGVGFLTKTLPRLGKAFDKALSGAANLDAEKLGFKALPNSKLPMLLGELFQLVLHPDGSLLPNPCTKCVDSIRQVLYLYYKYELPYTARQEQEVLARFEKTEQDISDYSSTLRNISRSVEGSYQTRRNRDKATSQVEVTREARILLSKVFSGLDLTNIVPRHGPGAVATRQRLWAKYEWTNVSARLTAVFPLDAYFYACVGHFCDTYREISNLSDSCLPARVILVPKDSRGPRLISCEPVEFQWIQQGIMRVIVKHVEQHPLTRECVFFTDQVPNQIGALYGSYSGKYASLDLNEASDRVSLDLVRLLFPPHICEVLEAARTLETELPDGRIIALNKFAPMGSALCFPVLALSVWAILSAASPNAYTRERIHVYGDDVIVPTAYAGNAIEQLESFGLKVNRDKSCISGLFRESCGMDAFNGHRVTPVRLRTVWSSTPSPEVYCSWIAYANQFYDKRWYATYDFIVSRINSVYTYVPDESLDIQAPRLRRQPDSRRLYFKRRYNRNLQRFEYKVLDLKTPVVRHHLNGWLKLLRYFTEMRRPDLKDLVEAARRYNDVTIDRLRPHADRMAEDFSSVSVSQYTKRGTSMLVPRWR